MILSNSGKCGDVAYIKGIITDKLSLVAYSIQYVSTFHNGTAYTKILLFHYERIYVICCRWTMTRSRGLLQELANVDS